MNGLEICWVLYYWFFVFVVLVLFMFKEVSMVKAMFCEGVVGYLFKSVDILEFFKVICKVGAG